MSDKNLRRILGLTAYVLTALYTAACIFLYYRFMGWESGSVYESDLPAHISLALDDGLIYSLISLIIIGLNGMGLLNVLCVILGVFAFLSVLFSASLIGEITEKKYGRGAELLLALLLNIVMPCYVRGLSDGRYMGMHTSSIWHNSTYLMMKWLGLWTILVYMKTEKDISKKLTPKSYFVFTLLLTLTTAAKPNFFLAAAPAMLVFLIIDIVRRNAPVPRLLVFASSVIPSFIVMLLQNGSLFGGGSAGSGIVIAPGRAMTAHTGYLIPVSFLSIAFPLMVTAFHIKDLLKNRYLLFAWICAAFGYMEYFLLSEEGARALDANLSWGYAFTIILVFGITLILWIEDVRKYFSKKNGSVEEKTQEKKNAALLSKIYTGLCGCILLYHTYCGMLFFIRLLQGVSYMMWG